MEVDTRNVRIEMNQLGSHMDKPMEVNWEGSGDEEDHSHQNDDKPEWEDVCLLSNSACLISDVLSALAPAYLSQWHL